MNMFNILFIVTLIISSLYFDVAEAGVSATTFKNKMLSNHNTLRQKTAKGNTPGQPAAKYMKTLSWDSKLASVAKKYSQKCIWQHNSQRGSQYGKSSVAENIFASTYSLTINNLLMSITSWYNEYKQYRFQNGVNTGTTHYSIMMNADTTKLGCGYTQCPTLSGTGWSNALFVVCDYYPSGGNGSPYLAKGSSFTTDEEEGGSTLSSAEIAAVVLCCVGCICLVIIGGVLYMRRKRNNSMKNMNEMEEVDDVEKDEDAKETATTPDAEQDHEEEQEIEIETYVENVEETR